MSMNSHLVPITSRDGTIWDGSLDLVVGRRMYYGTPRVINITSDVPLFSANSEIEGIIFAPEAREVLGWTRGNMYKSDDRYWVDADGGHIPVDATAEKPV